MRPVVLPALSASRTSSHVNSSIQTESSASMGLLASRAGFWLSAETANRIARSEATRTVRNMARLQRISDVRPGQGYVQCMDAGWKGSVRHFDEAQESHEKNGRSAGDIKIERDLNGHSQ